MILHTPRRKANKYHARKTTVYGRTFDSKREAEVYLMLREKQRLGKIKAGPKPRARKKPQVSALGESVVTALQDVYETRVTITEGRKKGKIVIEFAGSDDLQRIADLILRH